MDPDPASTLFTLFAVLFLLAANAFLVAAEFAFIAVRRTRLEQTARLGDLRAARVLPALERLEELAFASQIARSAATLLLGWVVARASRDWLVPLWGAGSSVVVGGIPIGSAETVATALGLTVAVLLHASLAQQLPKLLAIHRAEWIATRVALAPLQALAFVLRPLVRVLSAMVRGLLRLAGVHGAGFRALVQTPDEIRMLVEQGSGEQIEAGEREMLRGVFDFRETVAREVMTPRTDMVAVPVGVTLDELIRVVAEEAHSRIPVYQETVDDVVGVFLTKDLIRLLAEGGEARDAFDIRRHMREPHFIPDTKPVNTLLAELRQSKTHLAVVVDEFGGTYGIVTMEDLLEEIVGEIADEYDEDEPEFEPTPEGDVLIDGGAAIGEVNERFGLSLPEEDFDTLGGYIFGALGRVPVMGDVVTVPGPDNDPLALRVEETEERRVTCVRLSRAGSTAVAAEGVPAIVAESPN
ncbi:MAG TPA: hemolysin family protein [Longimicrobiaceae bacterium]|nr:hemolysin family protein [Longimicrobiaceae bacterium]